MMIFPFALVLMYGRMLGRFRHALVIFSVMSVLMAGTIVWSVYWDTLQPNPGLTAHNAIHTYEIPSTTAKGGQLPVTLPAVAGLPVDQHLGNLEGKEMRFGTSAGAVFDARNDGRDLRRRQCRTGQPQPPCRPGTHGGDVVELHFRRQGRGHDQHALVRDHRDLHCRPDGGTDTRVSGKEDRGPGGKARRSRPLGPSLYDLISYRLFAATDWGLQAISNPGAHGFSQMLFQFSSASANNGAAFDGLGVTYGLVGNTSPSPMAIPGISRQGW